MENLVIFKNSVVAGMLSDNDITCNSVAMQATNEIKKASKERGVYVTYLNGNKVVFTSLYTHTVNVPAKVLKSVDTFKEWTINRINHFFAVDKQRFSKSFK
jgi:hypothetical protein